MTNNMIAFLFYAAALSACFVLALALCLLDRGTRKAFIEDWKR